MGNSVNPTGNPLYAYKFSRDASGKPVFTVAGQTARVFTSKSVPTITSRPSSYCVEYTLLILYRQQWGPWLRNCEIDPPTSNHSANVSSGLVG